MHLLETKLLHLLQNNVNQKLTSFFGNSMSTETGQVEEEAFQEERKALLER